MSERPIAVTHNGRFHTDDVFATVVVQKVHPELEIVRTRDPEMIESADTAYDVGGVYDHLRRRYDHHQPGAHKRENGLTYSAFGLIWLHEGINYCDGDHGVWQRIDDVLVRGIDAGDNGEVSDVGDPRAPQYGAWQAIELLNPIAGSNEKYDEQFMYAVARATEILERLVLKTKSELDSAALVRRAQAVSPDVRYAELDGQAELSDCISEIEGLEYLLFPEFTNNTWQVVAVPEPRNHFTKKHPFPEEWAGLMNGDLANVTGVPDALFCHSKRFLAVAKSRAGALELLAQALK